MTDIPTLGVRWHDCSVCGTPWPFPHPTASPGREWKCHPCLDAEYASYRRDLNAKLLALPRLSVIREDAINVRDEAVILNDVLELL